MPGSGETVVTLTFEEKDGRTTLTSTSVWPSMEVRDMAMASGMEWGVIETYARLDELLDELLGTKG